MSGTDKTSTEAISLTDTVAANLRHVRDRIAAASRLAGRTGDAVTLIAVSKTQPRDTIEAAIRCDQFIFGENRVQEAAIKFAPPFSTATPPTLHLIGSVQTNKAREAVRIADVIESMDRPRLADAIADAIQREGRTPKLLVQVNVGDESQKSGVSLAEADRFVEECLKRFTTALVGLMCVPPAEGDPSPHFDWLARCASRHGLQVLSMGMSGDLEAAIAQGATHVRIGSALFGARHTA